MSPLPVYVEQAPPWLYCTFQYNPEVVEDLKFDLPTYSRSWDPDRRAWRISEDVFDEVKRIFRTYDYYIYNTPKDPPGNHPPPAEPPALPAHRVLHVAADAPPEVIRAAYRAMSKLHHPDTGGDEVRMKEINDAWEKLQ